uniref:SEC7 domain-containing protein n=2 Tax=Mesocestoides corti TaxID=53468 RepID=A0A5K3FGY3_MESCO
MVELPAKLALQTSKSNDFSQLVGEEFASFFDFTEQSLDTALRYFMTKLSLTGETQERERIFFHFSRRYVACNPGAFVSDDACHTLVCALILLNTDLHNQNVTRKVTCQDFVSSLMELNNGENAYSPDELIRLYEAFKQEPLRWPVIEVPTFNLMYGAPPMGAVPSMLPAGVYGFGVNGVAANGLGFVSPAPSSASPAGVPSAPQPPGTPFWPATDAAVVATWAGCNGPGSGGGVGGLFRPTASAPQQGVVPASLNSSAPPPESVDLLRLFANQFADMPKDLVAKEYMRGFVMRKCVMESHGKRTAIGKRSWKLFYARLRDLMLYLYKDAETAAAATRAEEMALGYMKQVYRFHLQCQHLRLYHEHQQRLQPALPPGSDTKEEPEGVVDANESSQDGSPGQPPTALENASPGQSASKDACHTPPPLPPVESSTSAAAHSPPLPSNGVTVPGDLEQHHQQQQQLNATAAAPTAFQMPPPPEAVICVAHAYACVADDYVKKPNVCRLKTKDGSEYLMQVNDGKELEYWVDKINYVAGLLSAPALPCPLASDHTFQRPVLPADITHLGVHEQLEGHQKRILDLTRDLTELKRRRMSAPSQPNLTYLSRDSAAPSPAPSVKSESAASDVDREACQRLQQQQQPPTSQMPYIPDSVLKSLQPSSAAASGLAPHQSERTLTSTFSTASLGRRRKKSFNALRGGTGSELAAQRAELDERVAYLEHELTRYKTYSRLLETELNRLQRLPQHPQSAQIALYTSPQIRGLGVGGGFYPAPAWQVCGPPAPQELPEETSSDAGASSSSPSPPVGVVASLPPPASKRSYGPTSPYVVGGGGGMRQPRSHRAQFRQYQLQRQQHRQQFYNSVSTPRQLRPAPQQSHTEETEGAASPDRETPPAPFYEVL